jgi:ABC-2 type transport system permease protein
MKPYVALGKRELWEHRSFWIVQLVIVGISILLTLFAAGAIIYAHYNGYLDTPEYASRLGEHGAEMFRTFIIASATPFNIALVALVCFYLIDTLNADRRDRSILFWRSLPVSDTATVLSKLFTAMISAPAIMLVLFIGFLIVNGIIMFIANVAIGVNPLVLLHPIAALSAIVTLAWALIAQSLWLLPFYGWFMLCSAWAKRNVWGWVILPPLGVIILEGIVLRTSHFAGLIGHHIVGLMGLMVGKSGFAVHDMADSTMPSHVGHIMSMESVFWFILQPEMWIGVVIGAAFVAGAIWLRRHRFEF